MRFSQREKKDLFWAGIMLSLAFAILLSGGFESLLKFDSGLGIALIIAFFTAGVGFLFHELMHKYVALGYGLRAEFRAFYGWLWLAVLFSLFGFILAAPGAVFISGYGLTRERNGKISLAGPVTNIVLALIFLGLLLAFGGEGISGAFFSFGLTINSLLAAFNMIPVMPFDGAKIKDWDVRVWGITGVIAVGLFVLSIFV
jgi:Zn-dependent protease